MSQEKIKVIFFLSLKDSESICTISKYVRIKEGMRKSRMDTFIRSGTITTQNNHIELCQG